MHGGMKIYAGSPAAARQYVEADRGRADDYYLTEGAGVARRFSVTEGRLTELAPLTGDAYATWVAGCDPGTGEPRGQLRGDGHAVRFVEVVVNGPKTWSLAAALHPDIATAYDAAQARAAEQIIGWLGRHATTRVGPRGGQVQVPVEVAEAVTVAHYTSRAGDPHRHLHLQINARVFAAGKWRGVHTVGVRDSLAAINGIGHAAVACDPQFRAALAGHGYVLAAGGEIRQLADFVGAFSARAAQIARNIDTYERDWAAAHPGETPGPALRRSWDARAWAAGRPDKVLPQPGEDLTARWLAELAALGYHDRNVPVGPDPHPGRRPGPGAGSGAGPGPAGRSPLGLERRRRARAGRTAARRRRHHHRPGGAHRARRRPHRPHPVPVPAAAGPRLLCRWGAGAHPGLDLPTGARRRGGPHRPPRLTRH